jgi:hypothetical protein
LITHTTRAYKCFKCNNINNYYYTYIHYFILKKNITKKIEIMNRTKINNYLTDSIDTELIDLWSKLDHQPKVIVCKYILKFINITISYI